MLRRSILTALCVVLSAPGAEIGGRVEYVGGTVSSVEQRSSGKLVVSDEVALLVRLDKQEVRVPFEKVNLLEYGQKASRRIGMAVVVSPLFLLTKKRTHFLTVGFEDSAGRQQAMVFRVEKDDIRSVLVALEARTGLRVEYQDAEARKAGKG